MTHDYESSSELSADDARILDALVDAGFDTDALEAPAPADKRRTRALAGLFELLEDYPVDDADETLLHATLARVDQCEDQRTDRMSFDTDRMSFDADRMSVDNTSAEAQDGPRRRLRLPDFISVAAVILIGASVVWPVSTHLRQRSIELGCASNVRTMSGAFNQYSAAWNNMLPTVKPGLYREWTPGTHNVINLNLLIKNGYCDASHLSCPGHEGQYGESYSYQLQTEGKLPRWGTGRITVVLGDLNPLVDLARRRESGPALLNSINHGGRGQWVLHTDGTTEWLTQPIVGNRDNIWLPGRVFFLRSGDRPTDSADVFLVP